MKGIFPTYNEFKSFNDDWRKHLNKEPQHKFIVGFYYPFAILGLLLVYGFLFGAISSAKERSRKSYHKNPEKYRKVIKEGIFFDTVEYHER